MNAATRSVETPGTQTGTLLLQLVRLLARQAAAEALCGGDDEEEAVVAGSATADAPETDAVDVAEALVPSGERCG